MEKHTLQVGSFEVNCSILAVNGRAWIVDPGAEPDRILQKLEELGLEAAGILLTHGHFDHIGAIPALQRAVPNLAVHVNPEDVRMLTHPLNQFPPDYPSIRQPANIHAPEDACSALATEGITLRVLPTPGHTPGGVCYHFPSDGLLFSGDTLFAGSVGRTDLPGGDMGILMDSLHSLVALPDATLVVPGHGPTTEIGREKANNPFLP